MADLDAMVSYWNRRISMAFDLPGHVIGSGYEPSFIEQLYWLGHFGTPGSLESRRLGLRALGGFPDA